MKLIIGALEFRQTSNLNIEGVRAFCKTLRTYYSGDVVFFVRNIPPEIRTILVNANIELIEKDMYEQMYNIVPLGLNTSRRIYYYLYLKFHPQYDQILAVDVYDVVFQNDPFRYFFSKKITISEEAKTIFECPINKGWMEAEYNDELEHVIAKPILCAGVIYGNHESTIQFSRKFFDEIRRSQKLHNGKPPYLDQAFVEYIFHTKIPDATILPYVNPAVMHVGHEANENILFSNHGIIIRGERPAIIHQYNRHQNLTNWINSTFGA